MNWKTLAKSKIVLVALILIAAFFVQLHYRQWQKRKSVEEQIHKLTLQEQEIEKANKDIAESLTYLQSAGYKERAAREQLGLKKEGEIVVKFDEQQGDANTTTQPQSKTANIEDWIAYFFPK